MSKKLVAHDYLKILHGGVDYSIAEVKERFWLPKLRQLTKSIIHECYGCKRFRGVACPVPAVEGNCGARQFQLIGIDFAGPLIYIKKGKQEGKVYIIMYSCSLTRAASMDLMRDQSLEEFLTCLQRFIARRGRPEKVYSDNFSTFVAASNGLKGFYRRKRPMTFWQNITLSGSSIVAAQSLDCFVRY